MRFEANLAWFDLKDEKRTFGKVVCKLAQK